MIVCSLDLEVTIFSVGGKDVCVVLHDVMIHGQFFFTKNTLQCHS